MPQPTYITVILWDDNRQEVGFIIGEGRFIAEASGQKVPQSTYPAYFN